MSFNNAIEWGRPLRYYLIHPIKFFKDFGCNVRAAYRRVKNGWCYTDAYNLDYWLLDVLPPMLRAISEEPAYPGTGKFDTYEKWQAWLREQAAKLEQCREDAMKNKYEDDFMKACEQRNAVKGITVNYDISDEEFKQLRDNYFNEIQRIHNLQTQLVKEVFEELGENFFCLWS